MPTYKERKEEAMRKYVARNRKKLIEQRNENSLTHLLKSKELTIEEKRALVSERNPFIYALGEKLIPATPKTLEEYTDWINRLYIGEKHASNKTVSKTK